MNTTTVRRLGLALLLAALGVAAAQAVTSPRDLSAQQRQELAALRDKLEAQGADRATCRLEHDKLLQSWGLEPMAGPGRGRGPSGPGALHDQLTQAQRTELHALMERLDQQDADPELRRSEHDKLLQSWGLEPGAGRGPCGPDGPGGPGAMHNQLTKAQRAELRALMESLDQQDADPELRRTEHDKLLQSWGLEPGAGRGWGPCGPEGPGGPGAFHDKLTKAQRKELRALRERLDEQDADPELRRAEHDKLLQSWGLEPGAGRGRGQGCGPRGRSLRGRRPCETAAQAVDPTTAGSGNDRAVATAGLQLLQGNQPNPFNPETSIRFSLPAAGDIRLAVYDLSGSLVRELQSGRLEAGVHSVSWNGESGAGRPAASGTYLYRLEWQGHTETGRMTLLR
ncbi:MAG: FlgD immunoglobulin-like domain containing protein [Candidatus Delongbacteria bacterium]